MLPKNGLPTSPSDFFVNDFENVHYKEDFLKIFYDMFVKNEIVINESIAIALERATSMDKRFWLAAQQTFDNANNK